MSNKLFGAFMFVAGAAIGSAATWKFIKTKYERITREEIDSVKDYFSKLNKNNNECSEQEEETIEDETEEENVVVDVEPAKFGAPPKPDLAHYAKLLDDYKSEFENEEKGGDESMEYDDPYVISPDDFDENDSYDKISLTYYADKVVEDDYGEILDNDDIDIQVGHDCFMHFGDYTDDVVHVRNEQRKTDYEITRDPRTYYEVYGAVPNRVYD